MDSSDDDLDIPLVFRKCYPCAPIDEKADSSDDEVLLWRTLKEKSGSPAFSLLDLDVSSDDDLDFAFNSGEKTAKPPQSLETGKKDSFFDDESDSDVEINFRFSPKNKAGSPENSNQSSTRKSLSRDRPLEEIDNMTLVEELSKDVSCVEQPARPSILLSGKLAQFDTFVTVPRFSACAHK